MTTTTIDRHRPTLRRTRIEEIKGPYARVPYCDEHNRPTTGCNKCRQWSSWRLRVRRRRIENDERITVPIAEVREHIAKLTAAGMKNREIREAAGITRGTFEALAYKTGRKFVLDEVARKLLAVPVPATRKTQSPRQSNLIDPTGSLRRMRALHRIGWTQRHIAQAAQLGDRLDHVSARKWLTHDTAAAVRRAYDLLSMTPGPSVATMTRASRAGWPPPLAWDDAAIDDPNAKPNLGDPDERGDDYDPLTVALAVDGRLTHAQLIHHRPDLIETVRRLAQRMTDVEIAHHLHWPGADDGPPGKTRGQNNVGQLRHRHGIPGPERFEAVYAYRPGGRRARNDKAA